MELHNEESEGQNILKGNVKRIVSGLLSAVTVLSAFLQPAGVHAAELEPAAYEAEYPALEKVKEKLTTDEIVDVGDYTVELDSSFDVEHDFSGIEFSSDKVKVTFHEAKNNDGKKFDIGKAGTYKAVYFVEPVSKNPSYLVSRNIIVKEKASAPSSGKQAADKEESGNSHSDGSEGNIEDGEGDLPGQAAGTEEIPEESMTEAEMEAVIEGMEQAEDTRKDAEMIAEEEGILLFAENRQMARASGSATMVKGRKIYYPGNLGNYSTCYFTVNGKIAYCLESAKGSPDTGSYAAKIIDGNPNLQKALVVPTGSATQDIGSYYEEESGNSVSLSVDWLERARVKVVKVDSIANAKLSGAVFGVYRDKDCTDLITRMPVTDSNGASEVEIVMTQDTVYLKEITAPVGYRYNATAYRVALKANQTISTTVPDVEQLGNLTIYKEGEVLKGASPNEDGTVFQYESRRQKGAVFNVYAVKDITTPYGSVVYKAGELVAENLTTGDNGSVTLKNLHLGTYRVKEMQAPKNFYNKGETKDVAVTYAGQMAEAAFSDTTFLNDRQKAEVCVVKKDKDTANGLAGGIFGLYASENITNADGNVVVSRGTLLDKATTDNDGNAVFSADLPIGFGYEVKEIQAPEGYVRNTEDIYSFRFSYTNDTEAKVTFSHIFANERVNATIRLQKKDKETNKNIPQGDATLEHAVYGLYARNDILHPDKKTGILYKAGEQVGTLTTDKEGRAEITDLYLGEYFVKEITPPTGYLADEAEYNLACSYEGDLVATVERDCTSPEQVKKQPFQIIKAADNGKTDADLLSGAGFTAWLVSSLDKKGNGGYDFDSAEPVVIGENGATEIFTDERGYACSIPLPFGTYIVRETTTPHNYTPVKDFLVRIMEHKPNTPQVWRVLLDDEFEAKLKIVKQDDE